MSSTAAYVSDAPQRSRTHPVSVYFELTKPRMLSLVIMSTMVGFFLASPEILPRTLLLHTLIGTALVAASSSVLNQWLEREYDAKMNRTLKRPLPSGRIKPRSALIFGCILAVSGSIYLAYFVNIASYLVAASSLVFYLALYTPLKRQTSLCTLVGAVPGALPALIGWAAVGSLVSLKAWILFTIIFIWQMPHFYAIAWLYRKDYEGAGFPMLSVENPNGRFVAFQICLYSITLLMVSLLPTIAGLTGMFYGTTAAILGAAFFVLSYLSLDRMDQNARMIFRASIIHLSLLLIAMVLDKV